MTISTISWMCSSSFITVIITRLGYDLTDSRYRGSGARFARGKLRICEALRTVRGTSYFPRAPFDVFVATLYARTNRCVITSRAQC